MNRLLIIVIAQRFKAIAFGCGLVDKSAEYCVIGGGNCVKQYYRTRMIAGGYGGKSAFGFGLFSRIPIGIGYRPKYRFVTYRAYKLKRAFGICACGETKIFRCITEIVL